MVLMLFVDVLVGNNPASAGKRPWWSLRMSSGREQPRTRGEKACFQLPWDSRRNNPARAGKRSAHPLPARFPREQPRTCGEKNRSFPTFFPFFGTTPHMRGKAKSGTQSGTGNRNNPAHAGKRSRSLQPPSPTREQPRERGEKRAANSTYSRSLGTTPHMRGKDRCPRL